MYHEITYHQAMRRRLRRVIYALLAVVIAVNLVIAVLLSQQIAQNQGVTTLSSRKRTSPAFKTTIVIMVSRRQRIS